MSKETPKKIVQNLRLSNPIVSCVFNKCETVSMAYSNTLENIVVKLVAENEKLHKELAELKKSPVTKEDWDRFRNSLKDILNNDIPIEEQIKIVDASLGFYILK